MVRLKFVVVVKHDAGLIVFLVEGWSGAWMEKRQNSNSIEHVRPPLVVGWVRERQWCRIEKAEKVGAVQILIA